MCAVSDDPVRREEDYAATMMATQNIRIAATAAGPGTYPRTGGIMEHPALKALVGLPEGYRIVGIVSLGYPAGEETPKRRAPAADKTTWLD
jgi:nitroreductase